MYRIPDGTNRKLTTIAYLLIEFNQDGCEVRRTKKPIPDYEKDLDWIENYLGSLHPHPNGYSASLFAVLESNYMEFVSVVLSINNERGNILCGNTI